MAVRGRWLIFVLLFALLGCGETKREEEKMAAVTQISPEEWQALAQKRVAFGHQSVGQNILDGMQFLASQAGASLPIVKSRSPVASGGINHFFVGQNEKPLSKLADFASALESDAAQGTDIALVKFCYLDFNGDSNAKEIADQYIATLDRLGQKFPNTLFHAFLPIYAFMNCVCFKSRVFRKNFCGSPCGSEKFKLDFEFVECFNKSSNDGGFSCTCIPL